MKRRLPVNSPLAADRPPQVKARVICQLPFGSTLGANFYIASSIPKTREIAVINESNYPMFYMGRGTDGRMSTYSQTDLVAQHEFKLRGNHRRMAGRPAVHDGRRDRTREVGFLVDLGGRLELFEAKWCRMVSGRRTSRNCRNRAARFSTPVAG